MSNISDEGMEKFGPGVKDYAKNLINKGKEKKEENLNLVGDADAGYLVNVSAEDRKQHEKDRKAYEESNARAKEQFADWLPYYVGREPNWVDLMALWNRYRTYKLQELRNEFLAIQDWPNRVNGIWLLEWVQKSLIINATLAAKEEEFFKFEQCGWLEYFRDDIARNEQELKTLAKVKEKTDEEDERVKYLTRFSYVNPYLLTGK